MTETRAPYITHRVATPESAVQAAVIDILLYQYRAMILRVNGGALQSPQTDDKAGRFISFCYWQVLGQDRQTKGVADVLALLPGGPSTGSGHGLFLAIECKSPNRRRNGATAAPSPDQARFLAAVAERGGLAIVCDDVQQLIEALERLGY